MYKKKLKTDLKKITKKTYSKQKSNQPTLFYSLQKVQKRKEKKNYNYFK